MVLVGKIICIDMKLTYAFYAIKDVHNVPVQVTQTVQAAQMDILNGHHYQYVHKIVPLVSMRIIIIQLLIFMTQSVNCVFHVVNNVISTAQIVVVVKAHNLHLLILTLATCST